MWAAMLHLGVLARLALARVLSDFDVLRLAHPEGQAWHPRPRHSAAYVPPERVVVTLAEHLRTQPAALWDAQPVSSALAPPVQQAAPHHKRSSGRGPRGV